MSCFVLLGEQARRRRQQGKKMGRWGLLVGRQCLLSWLQSLVVLLWVLSTTFLSIAVVAGYHLIILISFHKFKKKKIALSVFTLWEDSMLWMTWELKYLQTKFSSCRLSCSKWWDVSLFPLWLVFVHLLKQCNLLLAWESTVLWHCSHC